MTSLHAEDLGAVLGALPPGPRLIEASGQGRDAQALAALRDGLHAGLARLSPGAVPRIGVLAAPELGWGFAVLVLTERASTLPLNPDLPKAELAALLAEAGADCVLAAPEHAALAARLGLPVWRLDGTALSGAPVAPAPGRSPGLVLLTSGSTGTPKRVALTSPQLFASARNIARHFALSPADTALHALPMFHIGAFTDLVLAPLLSGGQVRAARDPGPAALAEALRAGATWMQLVPTMLAHCLAEWSPQEARAIGSGLRFLRMVSADLPPALEARARAALGCPLIQIYGMTETAGQVAANPLPPGTARPGSVGPAAGAEIVILDQTGAFVATGGEGEICLRGPTIMAGYEGTAETPRHGPWLRSGDLGRLDEDGYLFLTGRLKEMINRGGEKVSPLTVERAALALPGVREAAAYALPHPTLGESVGLSVVADPEVTEAALLECLAPRLAEFQMPRHVRLRQSFPRLGAGKVDRRRLAHDDRPVQARPAPAPTGTAATVARAWVQVLGGDAPIDTDDFFERGGDSLSVVDFLIRLEHGLSRPVDPNLLFETPRFAALVARLDAEGPRKGRRAAGSVAALMRWSSSWPGQRIGPRGLAIARNGAAEGRPAFWAALDGLSAEAFSRILGATRPHYILPVPPARAVPQDWRRRALGRMYAKEINAIQPDGPLVLGGYCLGATAMAHAARALVRMGREVALLVAFDHVFDRPTPFPVVLGWSNSPRFSTLGRYMQPARANWHWHPKGATVFSTDGSHVALSTRPFLRSIGPELNAYLDGAPVPVPPADGPSYAVRRRRWRARIRVTAPRFFTPRRPVTIRARVTNTSRETWPPTAESGLWLGVLTGHRAFNWRVPFRSWKKKLVPPRPRYVALDRAIAPGESFEAEIVVPFAPRRANRRLTVMMIDDGLAMFGMRWRVLRPRRRKSGKGPDPKA